MWKRFEVFHQHYVLVVTLSAMALCRTSWCETPIAIVDRFDQAVQNELHGYRSTFERSPSRASALRVDREFRGVGGRSMRVKATKNPTGFCGFWIHFFDMHSERPKYFDARGYKYLSFWVKGRNGGETFSIQLADEAWIKKQDSIPLGHVTDFLVDDVSTEWQEVIIPLPGQRLDLSRLGGLTLNFDSSGEFTIYLDDVSFKSSADAVTPETSTPNPRSEPAMDQKAMWLWSTADLLQSQDRWTELFDFCQQQSIGQLWIQLPYKIHSSAESASSSTFDSVSSTYTCAIQMQQQLRGFVRLAHGRHLKIHALDGAPEYCLREQHGIPLTVVDAIISFNRQGNADECFDGIHFDNEPYLLVAWNTPERREEILREFLELNVECQRRVREKSTMQYGIDLPFWWQTRYETTGKCHGSVSFRGVRKAASYHCIDMLDNVGVMNYRDSADGADGMLAHSRELLEYADRARGAVIYMGVETFSCDNPRVWFCLGLPRHEFTNAVLRNPAISNRSRIDGHRIHVLDDGQYVHVGIEVPRSMTDEQLAQAERALHELAQRFRFQTEQQSTMSRARLRAQQAIDTNPEWRSFQVRDIPAVDDQDAVAGFSAEAIMLAKVTFADNSSGEFREQTEAATDYFRTFKSYAGMAIHFYETYRSLIEKSDDPR